MFVLMGAAIFKLDSGATLTGVLKAEPSNLVYKWGRRTTTQEFLLAVTF